MNHELFMSAAVEQARLGLGRTRPNPAVGCIIVKDGQIVARGFHKKVGADHAEVDALADLDGDGEGCVMYVTLEPCCTTGRTPPCTQAILKSKIRDVVVGTLDTNQDVSGGGVKTLRDGGCSVQVGVLEDACRKVNQGYFSCIERDRPWIAIKYAMTADGKIATRSGNSKWITGEPARDHVAKLRDEFDAICVGTETLIKDNPRLTARVEGGRDPVRVLFDRTLRVPLDHLAFDGAVETFLFVGPDAESASIRQLEQRGIQVSTRFCNEEKIDIAAAIKSLSSRGIGTVWVEGGQSTFDVLGAAGLIDEVYAFIAPKLLVGDGLSPFADVVPMSMAEAVTLTDVTLTPFGVDILIHGYWPR